MTTGLDRLRSAWAGLTDREKRLVGLLAVVVAALLALLPLVVMALNNSALRQQNDELEALLDTLARRRPKLTQLLHERQAAELRYRQKAPQLGSFLEGKAHDKELSIREVVDQPEKDEGGFRRRNVRISMPGVALTPVMEMLASIKNSRYPVAIENLQVEHYQDGDRYNVKLGVVTFDRLGNASKANPKKPGSP
ncbi:MAG: type II secretion system protein GspM [Proteobacteria bacterium]|nr:type II secretion system protein GspM [Pseudomonadota bacterium]